MSTVENRCCNEDKCNSVNSDLTRAQQGYNVYSDAIDLEVNNNVNNSFSGNCQRFKLYIDIFQHILLYENTFYI